jgi:DNA-binding LacI/PurR family transcriptional regulator
MKKTTVKLSDIAKLCGVSTATVSLVLSDNPRISKETKRKVLKVVKQLGYYPNISARALSTNITKTLCVVVPQISHVFSDPFFGESLSGVYDYASKAGYRILFEVATYEFCFYKRYLQLFKERSIDGMLYIGSTLNDTYLVDIEKEGYPFILVGSYFPEGKGPQLSYVIGDNVKGGYLATKHLIELGHRRIAFITGHFKVISAWDRFLGYKQALKEAGITFDKSLIAKADFDEQTGYQAMKKLFDRFNDKVGKNDGFTAVFAGNDLMALGAIRAIKEKGLKVPDDIAVVGMDNIRMASFGESPLTTVEYNVYQMGKIACQKIIEQIEKKTVYQIKEVLPVKLVIRESCGANNYKKL